MFDRLNQPFGLLRYGVAPDHLGTKALASQFEKLFERDRVNFVGAIEIGKDLSLDALRQQFDVVVLAVGLSQDRPLDIPGEALPGVFGSGRVTKLFNSHPEMDLDGIKVGQKIVIVGHGNVAVDLIRLSLLGAAALVKFGVPKDVAETLSGKQLSEIHVVGRSQAAEAKFDVAMINELQRLPDVRFSSDADEIFNDSSETDRRIEAISSLVRSSDPSASREVRFHFGWAPIRIGGDTSVEFIEFTKTNGSGKLKLETDTVYSAIGFVEDLSPSFRRSELLAHAPDSAEGYLADGLYCVGWFKRGPNGTIPANRADARLVSDRVVRDLSLSFEKREM